VKTAFKIILSICLIGAIVYMLGGIGEVDAQIRNINPAYVVLVVVMVVLDRGLMTYKWGLLLRSRGIHLPFFRGMMIYCASWVWGLFLPTTIGADAIRAYCTSRLGIDAREIVASIIVERFLGFLSALLLAVLSIFLLTHLGHLGDRVIFVWLVGGGILLGAAILFAVTVNQRFHDVFHDRILHVFRDRRFAIKLREFHETYMSFAVDRRNLAMFFALTFGEQLVPILNSWLISEGMGIDTGILYFAMALPLAMLVSRIPVSFDGLGVFEGVFILLMAQAGLTASQAVAIAIVGRILLTVTLIPWWMAYVMTQKNIRVSRPFGKEFQIPVPQVEKGERGK